MKQFQEIYHKSQFINWAVIIYTILKSVGLPKMNTDVLLELSVSKA